MPELLRLAQGDLLNVDRFIAHRVPMARFEEACDVFGRAADIGALEIVLTS